MSQNERSPSKMDSKSSQQDHNPSLLLVAAVDWDILPSLSSNAFLRSRSQSSKLRVYKNDDLVDTNNNPVLLGKHLQTLLKSQMLNSIITDNNNINNNNSMNMEVSIYDKATSTYISLSDLLQEDVLQRLGTRLRIHVQIIISSSSSTTTSRKMNHQNNMIVSEPKAIMGRFYSYDASQGLQIRGQTLKVQEMSNQQNAGTGINVWDGALLLAYYLERRPDLVESKRVLELGAGCGLVGLVAGCLGAQNVLLTDLPYTLQNMQANINRHRHLWTKAHCQQIHCQTCDWFHPPTIEELGAIMSSSSSTEEEEEDDDDRDPTDRSANNHSWRPDVILVADCVWMQELVAPLLVTIRKLTQQPQLTTAGSSESSSANTTKVLISYQRRGKNTHEEFMAGLQSYFDGAALVELDVSKVGLFKPSELQLFSLDILKLDRKSEEVIWSSK